MKKHTIKTKQRSLKVMLQSYSEAFHDYEKVISKIDDLEQKIIKKSLESLEGVKISVPTNSNLFDYMPDYLWLASEVKEYESSTGFSVPPMALSLKNQPENKFLLSEREGIINSIGISSEEKLEGCDIILNRIEKMLSWSIGKDRKIKNVISTYNQFTSGKYD